MLLTGREIFRQPQAASIRQSLPVATITPITVYCHYRHYRSHSFLWTTARDHDTLLLDSGFRNLNIKEAAMAEKITIGLKEKGSAEGPAKTEKRPDIELTEEDLKQIAGGTTKAVQLRAD
jgi:hypothetical protein